MSPQMHSCDVPSCMLNPIQYHIDVQNYNENRWQLMKKNTYIINNVNGNVYKISTTNDGDGYEKLALPTRC